MFDFKLIVDSLIECDEAKVLKLVQNGLDEGVAAKEILNQGLIAGMDVVGEKMENEDMFIPEVLMAAKVMSSAVGILRPLLAAEDMSAMGRVIIGTVKGDLHDIGKKALIVILFPSIDSHLRSSSFVWSVSGRSQKDLKQCSNHNF